MCFMFWDFQPTAENLIAEKWEQLPLEKEELPPPPALAEGVAKGGGPITPTPLLFVLDATGCWEVMISRAPIKSIIAQIVVFTD